MDIPSIINDTIEGRIPKVNQVEIDKETQRQKHEHWINNTETQRQLQKKLNEVNEAKMLLNHLALDPSVDDRIVRVAAINHATLVNLYNSLASNQ